MKKILISLLSIFLLSTIFCNVVSAQTSSATNATTTSPGIFVSTVILNNTKIVSQNNRDLTISFDILNKVGIIPKIKYFVQLTEASSTGQTIFDEKILDKKVYDESLTLTENSSTTKTIQYTIPSSLSVGAYRLWIYVNNDIGQLAMVFVGEVKIGADVSNSIKITPSINGMLSNTENFQIKSILFILLIIILIIISILIYKKKHNVLKVLIFAILFSSAFFGLNKFAFAGATGFTWCANEGGVCSVSGKTYIQYGADSRWIFGWTTDGYYKEQNFRCDNGLFNRDPAHGTSKSCIVYTPSQIILYGDANRNGTPLISFGGDNDLSDNAMGFRSWNDLTSSFQVISGYWGVCNAASYNNCAIFGPDIVVNNLPYTGNFSTYDGNQNKFVYDNQISSMYPTSGPVTCTYGASAWGTCTLGGDGNWTQNITVSLTSSTYCSGGSVPNSSQTCTPACTDWSYSDWGNCSNQIQTRTATGKLPIVGCAGGPNVSLLSRACVGVSIKADATQVVYNGHTNISWTSSLATNCTTTKNVSGFSPVTISKLLLGTIPTGYLSKPTTYIVNCTDANNNRASDSVGISVGDSNSGSKSCNTAEDCQFVWSPDYTCELTETNDNSGDYTLHCYDPKDPNGPDNPGDIIVQKQKMPTCTFSQDYINKNTVLKIQPISGTSISSDIRWIGTDNISIVTSLQEISKIYTTVGLKTINAITRIKPDNGDAYVSACVSTTTMRLDTGTNKEI